MKISVIAFTINGMKQSQRLGEISYFKNHEIGFYSMCSGYDGNDAESVRECIFDWTKEQFETADAVIFIGATGIAVRAVAPCIKDKLKDIPVMVIDEKGLYVIPLLAGHVGGANEMAERIAGELGAQAVITTATDLNHSFAVDVFAGRNHLLITKKDGIKEVSSKILRGERITLSVKNEEIRDCSRIPDCVEISDYPPENPVDVVISEEEFSGNATLVLRKRNYVLGIGCRKNKSFDGVLKVVKDALKEAILEPGDIGILASIDLKKEEKALKELADYLRVPFQTYSAEELERIGGVFSSSEYVKKVTGTDNVCERAAMAAGLERSPEAKLVFDKYARDGVTVALVKTDWKIDFDE